MKVRPDPLSKNEDARQAMDKMDAARMKLRDIRRRKRAELAIHGVIDDLNEVEDLLAEVANWMWRIRDR